MSVADQSSIRAFLTDPATYDDQTGPISTVETHLSVIVLAGQHAYKLKRAVQLPYVDFSTPARRLEACQKEFELNRRNAPQIYVGVHRITREANGRLVFDGAGELFDAVVEMIRFDENSLLDNVARQGRMSRTLATELACAICRSHAGAKVDHGRTGSANIASVLAINEKSFATTRIFEPEAVDKLNAAFFSALERHQPLLDSRERAGKVRRCHGDLHLRNICLMNGVPTLFDCIEFDDAMATIDVLYDIAFLLMDLWLRGQCGIANFVMNRYLDLCDETDGLPVVSFFMALRAAVRAHVTATQAELPGEGAIQEKLGNEARNFFELAHQLLLPVPLRLVAIGGLSGSGKSTLAAEIAKCVGPPPGARVLASDRIRKRLHGVPAETALPVTSYTKIISKQVYATLAREARRVLNGGHAVIADAVFSDPAEREQMEQIARETGVPFTGLWLEAHPSILLNRVEARRGDVSDANPDVVRRQFAYPQGRNTWNRVQASGTIASTVAQAIKALS